MKTKKGELLVLLAGVLWGSIGLFIWKMQDAGASAAWISFLRVFFACMIMTGVVIWRRSYRELFVNAGAMWHCALLGLICHGIYNIFYSLAVMLTGVAVSGVLLNIAPLFTAIFSVLLFKERLSSYKLLALFINVPGCTLAATGGQQDFQNVSVTGLLFGVMAGLCYALTAIIGRVAGNATNAFVMSAWSYAWAALSLLAWLFVQGEPMPLTGPILVYGFFFALIPTAFAYVLYYDGVHLMKDVSSVPVWASLEVVVAVLIGVCLLHESFNVWNLLGLIMVVFSLVMLGRREP